MYESLYPAPNVISGIVRLVVGWGKHFIEGFPPVLCFDFIVAIGLDQFFGRCWILMGLECFIKVTKLLAWVVAARSSSKQQA
jgi:hypothetical protein